MCGGVLAGAVEIPTERGKGAGCGENNGNPYKPSVFAGFGITFLWCVKRVRSCENIDNCKGYMLKYDEELLCRPARVGRWMKKGREEAMAGHTLKNRVRNAWEYKRAAFLWTLLSTVVFAAILILFVQFTDAYFTSGIFTGLIAGAENLEGVIYVLLDDYVLMSFLLVLFACCCFAFLSQLWTDDVVDYYVLLLMWSLSFYLLYGLNLFNPGGGSVHYLVRVLSESLYQLSAIPLILCLYMKTERYRGFVRVILMIEYVLCILFTLLSVTGLSAHVLSYVGFACDLLCCVSVILLLIIGIREARQGNGFYRLFCCFLTVELVGMTVLGLISLIGKGDGMYLQRMVILELFENLNLHPIREYFLQRVVLINLLLILFINFISELMHNKMSVRVLNYEKESAQGYAAAVRERIDAVRRVKHETMHHINACNMLYSQGEYQRLGEYLQKLQTDGEAIQPLQYSNNLMIDYLVMSFSGKAEVHGIALHTDIAILPELSISDSDLCSLLNNVLQNAIEACLRIPDPGARWIRLEIRADENKVYFTCINSCDGYFVQDNGRYLTTKPDGTSHGYGMSIIQGLCRRNGGAMASEVNGDRFTVKVALPHH